MTIEVLFDMVGVQIKGAMGMIPNTNEILAQLVLLWKIRDESLEKSESVTMGKIASDLMYPPLFIINALDCGVDLGILKHDYETDKLELVKDYEKSNMGKEIGNLIDAIEEKLAHENEKKQDLSLGLIQQWCMGVRPSACELALYQLVANGTFHKYDMTDTKDKKSVYTFYTLSDNKGKKWGKKQFKKGKKGKK